MALLPDELNYAKSKDTKEYPLPAFYFAVAIGNETGETTAKGSFTEVSGLTAEIQPIEYRDGFDPITVPRKIPGMRKYANVVLKRGVFYNNVKFQEWIDEKEYNKISRKVITISLMDSKGKTQVQWVLSNAYPIKIESPTFKADGNEVAIETIELVHEGLKVTHAKAAK